MNLILKRDPVWLGSLTSPNASPTLLLLGGDGQQVAVPAHLLLAVSPLVRSILTDLLPPAYSPCFLSLPAVTEEVLQAMVDIVATGAAGGEHLDKIEDVRTVFEMLGVNISLVNCHLGSIQAGKVLDGGSVKVKNSSEGTFLDDENIIKFEVIVKKEDEEIADAEKDDDKFKALAKSLFPQNFTQESTLSMKSHTDSDHNISCYICNQTFSSENLRKKHVNSVHNQSVDERSILCILCNQKFTQKSILVKHIKSAHELIKIPCKLCPQKFTYKQSLLRHIRSVHEQIKIPCKLCPEKFSQKHCLVRHIKSVHEQIKIPCNLCSRKFTQKISLVTHVKSVHDKI